MKENAPIEFKYEIDSITNEIKALANERLKHVGNEIIFFENEQLKKEIQELRSKLTINEFNTQSISQPNSQNISFETKLQEHMNECISDRAEITKSVQKYIQSFENGDMMQQIETKIHNSIRDQYESKINNMNSEFELKMTIKDENMDKEKELYELKIQELIKTHNEHVNQLTEEKIKQSNEIKTLNAQLDNIKSQITTTSIQ